MLHPLGYVPRRPPRPCLRPASYIPLGGVLGGLPALACVQLAVHAGGVLYPLGYIPRRPSRPCLCPASSIPLGVLHPLGYVPRRLPVLACVLLALHAVGASPAGIRPSGASRPCLRPASSTSLEVGCTLGYAPRRPSPPPHTHPSLDLLGCIFCNSVTLLYKAHALPHSAGLKNTP